jgi:hypothetical protein
VPGRALPAALLVALSAVVGLFAAPAALGAAATPRSPVAGSPQPAAAGVPSARPASRDGRDTAAGRRATPVAALVTIRAQLPRDSSLPGAVPAVAAVLALAGWLAAVRAARATPARAGALVPLGTPGSRLGRAPPAYATA